jgi:hypothetical protein
VRSVEYRAMELRVVERSTPELGLSKSAQSNFAPHKSEILDARAKGRPANANDLQVAHHAVTRQLIKHAVRIKQKEL